MEGDHDGVCSYRQPRRSSAHDEHPSCFNPRHKEDGNDDDNDGRNNRNSRHAPRQPNSGGSKLRLSSDSDQSPRCSHVYDYYRDRKHCCATSVGGLACAGSLATGLEYFAFPKPTMEEIKVRTDITLQDLFSAYANQLREVLHEVLDNPSREPSLCLHKHAPLRMSVQTGCARWRRTSRRRAKWLVG